MKDSVYPRKQWSDFLIIALLWMQYDLAYAMIGRIDCTREITDWFSCSGRSFSGEKFRFLTTVSHFLVHGRVKSQIWGVRKPFSHR